uniref:Nucleosome assembly protein 1 like 5 n=1 Tax=Equus caballus TaxID=9796 RepID=F6TLL3_HORSE
MDTGPGVGPRSKVTPAEASSSPQKGPRAPLPLPPGSTGVGTRADRGGAPSRRLLTPAAGPSEGSAAPTAEPAASPGPGSRGRGRAHVTAAADVTAACRSRKVPARSSAAGLCGSHPALCGFSSDMADAENQGPAEPSQAAEAAEEVMAEGGAQGGDSDSAAGDSDSAAGDSDSAAGEPAEEPQTPAENAPKPKNDFIESLPNSVKCRVLALKKLQKRCDKIEAKFDKEFQALEKKYNDIYKPLLAKIQELTGEMEGCAWTLEGEEEDDDEEEYEDEEEEEEAAAEAAKNEGPHSAVSDDAKK